MHDRKPPHEQSLLESMSAKGLAWYFVSVATVGVVAGLAALEWVKDPDSSYNRELGKAREVFVLEQKLQRIQGAGSLLNDYIKSAQQRDIPLSGCDVIDPLQQAFANDHREFNLIREKLSSIDYITAGANISYRNDEQKSYAAVAMKVGQLKEICKSLFSPSPNAPADESSTGHVQMPDSSRNLLDKTEIPFTYNK